MISRPSAIDGTTRKTNVMSNMVKSRFAGLLRGILRRMDPPEVEVVHAPAARPVAAGAPVANAAPTVTASAPPPFLAANPPPNTNEIAVPLAPIITSLPMDLRGKTMAVPPPGMTINLPVETVTTQLAFGAVKITFGELRQLAPGIFANSGGEHDNKMISLPLGEILPRLNPSLLARRAGPKVQVAEDINGPFGGRGNGVAFTTQPLKAPTPTAAQIPLPTPPAPKPTPPPLRINQPVIPPTRNAPVAFTPPPNFQRSVTPAPAAPPIRQVTPAPVIPPISVVPIATPTPVVPRPEPALPTIFAALWDLAENWPEELKNEISHSALANVSVPLAGNLVAAGLKRGRVTMTWKQLRTLAKPSSSVSPNDDLELNLPLKIIAPLFFAAQKNLTPSKTKANVSAEIPDLFFGFPQPAPEPPASAPKPVEKKSGDSNFFVWEKNGETPKAEENIFAPPPVPQTDFMSRQTPPKEVVARAVTLPGVAGALVTLPDGLRVAGEVPAEFNADTLAAFIPQMFERMNQSAKELRMGALNNVSFTVGNVPWRIIRVNSVYLAAFGRAGESLPAAQLAALAGELDRKKTQ
jgi:predicted regulator of Ras-like GTPase activity (Roadblock/LC7/MglB family)